MRLLLALSLAACTPPKDDTQAPKDSSPPEETGDPGTETGETADSAETGDSAESGETGDPVLSSCDNPQPWSDEEGGTGVKDLAGDFTLPTTEGDWTLSEMWTGCESYLFLIHQPGDYTETLWSSSVETFLERAPDNIHVFFLSDRRDAEDAAADVEEAKAAVDEALAGLDEDQAALWRGRFHYVPTPTSDLGSWVGDLASQSWSTSHFAIDRFQRLRSVGMLYNLSRERPALRYLANEPIYYEFEWERELDLADDGATVIEVWDEVEMGDPGWAGVSTTADVELPDAAAMAGFDTLKIDLTMDCADHQDANCPAWDYLVYLYLCDEDDPDSCGTEIGRFITTYWREGRYVVDASPYLALMANGGTRRLRFYTTQTYLVSMDLRLSTEGSGLQASDAEYLWSGAGFNESYNENFETITFTVPEDVRKVELVATISGHGFAGDTENCAEFCNHTHHFVVNGDDYVKEHPEAGTSDGCEEQVADGTVPNQFGTWYYGRGGWCPGREVTPWRQDITDSVTIGGENTIAYYGLLGDETYVPEYTDGGFWARIDMTSWLVFWR